MHSRFLFTRALGASIIAAALIFIGSGCSSDRGRGPGGAERRQPPMPLAGQETFFDGQLVAKVTVGNEGMPQVRGGGSSGERSGSSPGGGRRRGGGGGGGPGGGGFGGLPPGGGSNDGAPVVRPIAGGGGMPQLITLSFTNQGAAPVDVFIHEFASLLGNFAVRPDKLTIAPGETVKTESMATQLGGRYTEVDARLVLRVGDKKETKTFRLIAVTPTPLPSTPPPAATDT